MSYSDLILKSKSSQLFCFILIGVAVLISPYIYEHNEMIVQLVNKYKTIIHLYLFILLVLWIHSTRLYIGKFVKYLQRLVRYRKNREIVLQRLHSLSQHEMCYIYYCIIRRQQTFLIQIDDPVYLSLIHKQLATAPGNITNAFAIPLTLRDFVYEYLIEKEFNFIPVIDRNANDFMDLIGNIAKDQIEKGKIISQHW